MADERKQLTPEEIYELLEMAGFDLDNVSDEVLRLVGYSPNQIKFQRVLLEGQRQRIKRDCKGYTEHMDKKLDEAKAEYKKALEISSGALSGIVRLSEETANAVVEKSSKIAAERTDAMAGKAVGKAIREQLRKGLRSWINVCIGLGALMAGGGLALGIYARHVANYAYDAAREVKNTDVAQITARQNETNKTLGDLEKTVVGEKNANTKFRTTHDESYRKDKEAEGKRLGDLDKELAKKADRTDLDLKLAGINTQITDLRGVLDAQTAKYAAGEEARNKLVARTEETRGLLEKTLGEYNAFKQTTATKEYSDEGIATLKKYIDDELRPKISDGKAAVEQLRKQCGDNSAEVKRLAGVYGAMDELCRALDGRLKKTEEDHRKLMQKPAGNANYQPPSGDR